ncbi:MAG: hypothetical protein AVDCRST_MAG90-1647, partial [uncultured Microvirga sp.]
SAACRYRHLRPAVDARPPARRSAEEDRDALPAALGARLRPHPLSRALPHERRERRQAGRLHGPGRRRHGALL